MSRRSQRHIEPRGHRLEQRGGLLPSLSKQWRQQYIDMGHCRLKRCSERLLKATRAELADLGTSMSFTAMALSASSCYGTCKEDALLAYVRAAISCGLNANDTHQRNPSVVLAAYHGFPRVLRALLDAGCPLEGHGEYGNAIMAAVRNGQPESLALVLAHPTAKTLLAQQSRPADSVLFLAVEKRDVTSVRMLRDAGLMLKDCMRGSGPTTDAVESSLVPRASTWKPPSLTSR